MHAFFIKNPRPQPGKIMGGWKGNVFWELSAVAAVIVSVAVSVTISAPIAFSIAVSVAISASVTISVSEFAVRGTEDGAKAAAGVGLSHRGEQIHRKTDILEAFAGVTICCQRGTAFRHTSAQRIYHHIYRTEQLHDGEQPDGHIDSDRCAQGSIAVVPSGIAGIAATAAVTAARIAGRMTQLCRQSHSLAFGNDERSAAGSAVAELVCYRGYVGFSGSIPLCKKRQKLVI